MASVTQDAEMHGEILTRTCSAHCTCALGRWMRSRIALQDAAMLRRIPDLLDVMGGRTRWSFDDPTRYRDQITGSEASAMIREKLAELFKPVILPIGGTAA